MTTCTRFITCFVKKGIIILIIKPVAIAKTRMYIRVQKKIIIYQYINVMVFDVF